MLSESVRSSIKEQYGLHAGAEFSIFGSGLINKTYLVSSLNPDGSQSRYILQSINNYVFKAPDSIDRNLATLGKHLELQNPLYNLPLPLKTAEKLSMICLEGVYYRLFLFVEGSCTVDVVENLSTALNAAKTFGGFTKAFSGLDIGSLEETLFNFHNLTLRYNEYTAALGSTSTDRLATAQDAISRADRYAHIVTEFRRIVAEGHLVQRVTHHDTKISNILFDAKSSLATCVIDLDTVMPGYFISDVGDMIRTYACATGEEDFSNSFAAVKIRAEYIEAIMRGYMEEMGAVLTAEERKYLLFSGEVIIYMQALRFLTDYLNNDVYYGKRYLGHNLNRALNQLHLLEDLYTKKSELEAIVENVCESICAVRQVVEEDT